MSELGQLGIIVLYVVGMAFIVAETFLPGAVLGIIGFFCVLASIWMAFGLSQGFGWALVGFTVLSVPVLVWLWFRVIRRVMAIKRTQKGISGAMVHLKELVGREGVALTQLRPAGMARFGDKKVDVVSEGPVIARDARVKVIEVEANRVVVRAVSG